VTEDVRLSAFKKATRVIDNKIAYREARIAQDQAAIVNLQAERAALVAALNDTEEDA
jgi:hypothetical protein